MPVTSAVRWDPSRLNAAIARGNRASFKVAHADALARRHNKSKSGVRLIEQSSTTAILKATGLQTVFESGRQGGYEINPGAITGVRRSYSRKTGTSSYRSRAGRGDKTALKFTGGDGGFAAYAIGGPMRPYPAMGPAASDWARGGAQATMRTSLAAGGFR